MVQRWDEGCFDGAVFRSFIYKNDDGDFVEYEDYLQLEAENKKLKETIKQLNSRLDEVDV